ncbi:MAG: flagellar motor protein MotA [Alphaproteobacteria bacterium]|jgi:hypothetical protein
MTSPQRYLTRMAIFLVAAIAVVVGLYAPVTAAFMTNPALNGVIGLVLIVGIVYTFRQVWLLNIEVQWLETIRSQRPGLSVASAPKLLAPLAAMMGGDRQRRLSLSATALRSVLDGIAARLDEARDISRYMIGLLIFLGLLGTFWGLIETIRAIAEVIAGLQVDAAGDTGQIFANLKSGLEAPLSGMGTAFSSSLFGLAGSLLVGFLDLQANQAQNRFYNDLEDWLSGATRLSSGIGSGDGDQSVPAYIQALLETTADSLDNLQRTIAQGETTRARSEAALETLADRMTTLTDQMRTEQDLMVRIAENQAALRPVLQKLAEAPAAGGMDETTRNHIRNVDVHLARLLEDSANGRAQMTQELRSEIRLLARTIAALADEGDRGQHG